MTVTIQPQEQPNGTLPYPYHIDDKGMVGRQDFWQGNPYKLIGFAKRPVAGDFSLGLKPFLDDPQKAVGLYPVFADAQDEWVTQTTPIQSVNKK